MLRRPLSTLSAKTASTVALWLPMNTPQTAMTPQRQPKSKELWPPAAPSTTSSTTKVSAMATQPTAALRRSTLSRRQRSPSTAKGNPVQRLTMPWMSCTSPTLVLLPVQRST